MPPQDAQKGQTSHAPNPGAPRRAVPQARPQQAKRRCILCSVRGAQPSETRMSLADSCSILLEKSDEDEVSDTSEESRRWQRHYPSQDHVTHGRPAHAVPAFEKANSDNGGAADVSG